MIAALPMYDRPANRAAHDRLWTLIRDHLQEDGIAAPETLDRTINYRQTWKRSDLLLGQICVMPYRTTHANDVTLIGASDYGLDGCDPGYFRSVIVCRADDARDLPELANARFAANALHSYSGYDAVRRHFDAHGLDVPAPKITGSHDASIRAIAAQEADFASIDAQTWWMQQQDMPETSQLRVVCPTSQAPGQSFITHRNNDPAPYFAAIKHAISALPEQDKHALGLRDIIRLPETAYA